MPDEFVPEADAQEQAASVKEDEDEEVDPIQQTARRPIDAPDADVLEQAEEVPDWDGDDR